MYRLFFDFFYDGGLNSAAASWLSVFILLALMAALCWLANFVAKKIISRAVYGIVKRSQTKWDDIFYDNRVFSAASHLAPALVVIAFVDQFPFWREFIYKAALIYMAFVGYLIFDRIINSSECIYRTYEVSKEKPITSYLQVLKIFCAMVCVIISVGIIVDKSPWSLLSGIGAMTAVLLVIFKDTITGLSAGIQLSANKMLHIGDWIEMPKFGADGEVIEITLNTVKVQNWDKTLIMIPIYCMISESFKNWRGMYDAGGRRIKRALYIDVSSVSFCGPEILASFKKSPIVGPVMARCLGAPARPSDAPSAASSESLSDAERSMSNDGLTNAGAFRRYIVEYLRSHPMIDRSMPAVARQLHPCEYGLPVEIYAFCSKTEWLAYEEAQAGIVEHLIAAAPEFGLKIFQRPAGGDIKKA